jgi:hypothetical protein
MNPFRSIALAAPFLLLGIVTVGPAAAYEKPADTKARFEELAGQLKMFPTGEVVCGRGDRPDRLIPAKWTEPWLTVHAAIAANQDRVEDLVALLKHADPRVRTLALAALFAREDPRLLPYLAAMVKDTEKTVPDVRILRAFVAPRKDLELVPQDFREQTVGRVAEMMLNSWLQPAGYAAADFDSYWAERKDHKACAGWFLARLNRAGQATSAFDPKRTPLIRAVRKEVDALPAIERDWTLTWLGAHHLLAGHEEPARIFATPDELLAAGRRLGPDRLMDLLDGKVISPDPDLAPNQRRTRGRDDLILWVLRNAGKLLRPDDAPAILALEPKLRDQTPWCALAAAELQPENASKWLRAAFGRFPGQNTSDSWKRADLAAGLWRIVGTGELDYLVDWFYGEKVETNPHTPQTEIFLRSVRGVRAPADRKLLARLVTDPRLNTLDHQSLRAVIEVVNGWTKQPVVDVRDLRPAWEHGGWTPETPRDLQVVAGWRERLRKSLAEWQPEEKKPGE